MVERLAAHSGLDLRPGRTDEMSVSVGGGWTDYHVAFTWLDELEALHVACAFDLKVPSRRRGEMLELISLINEQLWVGHFDLWANEDVVMFRHSLLLAGGAEPTGGQCETLLKVADRSLRPLLPGVPVRALGGQDPRARRWKARCSRP